MYMNNSPKQKLNNEDLLTRRMLQTIRESNEPDSKVLLNESSDDLYDDESSQQQNNDSIAITDDIKFGNKVLSTQKQKLIDNIKSPVKFGDNPLVYYPQKDVLEFEGQMGEDMNGMKFKFKYNDEIGVYIWADGLNLTKENARKIGQLRNAYEVWVDEWMGKTSELAKAVRK